MSKKRSIILCIILMLLCLVGGVSIGLMMPKNEKVINNNETNQDNNLEENEDNKLLTVSEFFDEKCNINECDWIEDNTESLNIMSKYNHGNGKLNILMYELTEDYKNDIAANNLIGTKGLCQDYFDLKESNCYENDEIKIVSYDELLEKKKELFGDDSTLEKKNFLTEPIGEYSYFSNIDSFVFKGYEAKDGVSGDDNGIIQTEKSKDKMFIVTYEIVAGIDYNGIRVYGYTFKKQNNSYYLEEITKLRFE